jgi:YegS C-terminal NAD kinase beta sandwich-like domain
VTIAKGQAWGSVGGPAPVDHRARSDCELVQHVLSHREGATGGVAPLIVGLTGGSLWESLGGQSVVGRLEAADAMHLPVDLMRLDLGPELGPASEASGHRKTLDERRHWAVATIHATARLRRPVAVIGNIGAWKKYRALPRAHPGDGIADALWGDLGWQSLWQVSKRAVTGTHLPHPGITARRAATVTIELERPCMWFADGNEVGRAAVATITVEPDAVIVVL